MTRLISLIFLHLSVCTYGQGKLDFVKVDDASIDIYTPPNYSSKNEYPVVYFNDGQMLFGHRSVCMALQLTLDSLIENNVINELIVVGIAADRLRSEKYVPYQGASFEQMADGSSYASYYSNFLINRLIPHIDQNYGTIREASGRAIFGFSFGGLNAIWMMLNNPEVFSTAGGFSPSFWVDDFAIFDEAIKYQAGQKIWFDIGTAEWNYYVPFQKLLKEQGAKINEEVFYSEVPGGLHTMMDWNQRIEMPFLIFAGKESHTISKMEVEIEIIPSQSIPGKKFTRLNPIVTCKSGLIYSLAYEADYEVLNPSAGKVSGEGSFKLFGDENLDVIVTYKQFTKKVKVRSKLLVD
ncbi:alpha/beta hydrolase-fold protein [Reichenbachiella sp.]|uniref:alpha/beta hydrolase n=1 Tax=Reichenbachiella sp. TaxID=2184521 RepID=UPI00329895E1